MSDNVFCWCALLEGASLNEFLDELVHAAESINDDPDVRDFKLAALRLKIRLLVREED